MAKTARRYWDSSCFIAWLKPEEDRYDACREVIRAAERGGVQIVTSTISLTEVIKLNKGPIVLPQTMERTISDFFKQEYIVLIQLTRFIAESARALVWKYPALRPKDAIHAATALYAGIPDLDTFDRDFLPLDGQLVTPQTSAHLRVSTPHMPQRELPLETPPGPEAPTEEGEESEVN